MFPITTLACRVLLNGMCMLGGVSEEEGNNEMKCITWHLLQQFSGAYVGPDFVGCFQT